MRFGEISTDARPVACSSASITTSRATSSGSIAVLSTTTASFARTSGDVCALAVAPVALVNFFERARQVDRVALLLMLAPAPLGPHFGRRREKNLQLRLGKNHAADVAAFHHHAALLARATLLGHQHVAHARHERHFRRRLRHFRACESRRSRLRRRAAPAACRPARRSWRRSIRVSPASAASCVACVERHAAPQRLQRDRAVHRARVNVEVAHQLRHAPRERALPRAHRPVNRDDQFLQRSIGPSCIQRCRCPAAADEESLFQLRQTCTHRQIRLNARSISRTE